MNVEIGAEAAQFPEKEYINGFAVAVHRCSCSIETAAYGVLIQHTNSALFMTD